MIQTRTIQPTVRYGEVDDLWRRGLDLMKAHAADDQTPAGSRAKPNWEVYFALEKQGVLVVQLTELRSELIGYAISAIYDDLHNSDLRMLDTTAIYVCKHHRSSVAAIRLIQGVEACGEARDVHELKWHAVRNSNLWRILMRRGYLPESETLSKPLRSICPQP